MPQPKNLKVSNLSISKSLVYSLVVNIASCWSHWTPCSLYTQAVWSVTWRAKWQNKMFKCLCRVWQESQECSPPLWARRAYLTKEAFNHCNYFISYSTIQETSPWSRVWEPKSSVFPLPRQLSIMSTFISTSALITPVFVWNLIVMHSFYLFVVLFVGFFSLVQTKSRIEIHLKSMIFTTFLVQSGLQSDW